MEGPYVRVLLRQETGRGREKQPTLVALALHRCNVLFAMLRDGTVYDAPEAIAAERQPSFEASTIRFTTTEPERKAMPKTPPEDLWGKPPTEFVKKKDSHEGTRCSEDFVPPSGTHLAESHYSFTRYSIG